MLYDITRKLSERTAVWPGDEPVRLTRGELTSDPGSSSTGSLTTSLHAGTHLDAPAHVFAGGAGADRVPLEACLGEALVVDCGEASLLDAAFLAATVPVGRHRLLLKTRASARPDDRWGEDFPVLAPDAARWLVGQGLLLLGVDSPSVDPANSPDLAVHRLLLGAGVVILENLALAEVPPGAYELIALPLRLDGMDGSPVRAVLRSLES